jgi:hypothetical protein
MDGYRPNSQNLQEGAIMNRTEWWRAAILVALVVIAGAAVSPAHAQGTRKDDIVLGPRGTPVAGATVAVCTQPATTTTKPCSPLASLFSDSALTQALANPLAADGLGNYHFYAAPGKYTLQIYSSQLSTTVIPDVILPNDPMNPTVSSITSSGGISAFSLSLAGNLTVGGSVNVTGTLAAPNVAGKPATSDAICYASTNGNDSNDGLSWGSDHAKLTIGACIDAVPATGGTIKFTSGASATSTAGQGIWLMGPLDPNYANPPAGWRHAKPLSIIGVSASAGGSNNHFAARAFLTCGSAADLNHPCVWLSGVNVPTHFENAAFQYPGRGLVIGECSNNSRTGTCISSGITFLNDYWAVNDVAGNGPTVDITGGSFWIYFIHSGAEGSQDTNGATADKAAAILIDGRGNGGSNLIFFDHLNTDLGGIKVYPGANTNGIYVDGYTTESMLGPSAAVWFTSTNSTAFNNIRNVQVADNSGTVYAVQVDGNGPPESVHVSGSGGGAAGTLSTLGPMVVENSYPATIYNSNVDPARLSQGGFFGGNQVGMPPRIIGRVDAARRIFGPTAARFPNLASQLPSAWTTRGQSGITLTGGKAAPDGTTNAGRVSASGAQIFGYFYDVNQTYAAGDIVLMGAWFRSVTANGHSGGSPLNVTFFASCATATDISGQGSASSQANVTQWIAGDGEWNWGYRVLKITTAPTNPCETGFAGLADSTHTAEFYTPVLLHIATGTISDNEAAELGMNLSAWPDNAPAAAVSTLRGHDLMLQQHLTQPSGSHDVAGTATLSSGTVTVTFATAFASAPVCVATDQTAANAVKVAPTTTNLVITGTGADVIAYQCIGNPN